MFVMVSRPLRLRLADQEIQLEPGRLIQLELTETQAARLRARVGQDVRWLTVGSCVAWNSPLFGPCVGRVAWLPVDDWIAIERHPITGQATLLPCSWITVIVTEVATTTERILNAGPEDGASG